MGWAVNERDAQRHPLSFDPADRRPPSAFTTRMNLLVREFLQGGGSSLLRARWG
jgi:hypothetical protein